MRLSSSALSLLLATILVSTVSAKGVRPKQIKKLVTFGDSYTDVNFAPDGGVSWPVYAAGYAQVSLFPFAGPFLSLFEGQLPLYFEEKRNRTLKLDPNETIYTLWLGTNDVGANSIVSGNTKASIVDVSACLVNWVKVLYESGARNFLFQNMIPLEATPLYASQTYPNFYWSAQRNTTEWNIFIRELVLSANALTKLMLQDLAPKLPDAHVGLFDTHGLFTDMFENPAKYLNGTAPLNVTHPTKSCVFELNGSPSTAVCTTVKGDANKDSYLWGDELHPGEQADRIVAREVAKVIRGEKSRWSTWLS
ncbi:GDSL lipase/esterase [Lyophyllum atratum]|nr:GDSL lipase/esterase [Lyophyllum atratum]